MSKDNGDALVFGYNKDEQLDLSYDQNINNPTLLMNDKSIRNIICSKHYTIIYK